MVSTISKHGTALGTLARVGHCRWVLFLKVPDYTRVLELGCVWCAWGKVWMAGLTEEVKRVGRGHL